MTDQPEVKPLFVCGLARSGTTYLSALLNHHPAILVTNESRIFLAPIQFRRSVMLGPLSFSTGPMPLSLAAENEATIRHRIFDMAKKARKVHLRFEDGVQVRTEIAQLNLAYVGDKYPNYGTDPYISAFLRDFFPEGRWIFIFRSPLRTMRSQLRLRMNFDLGFALTEYVNQLRQAEKLATSIGRQRFLPISYEHLVSPNESGRVIRTIATFLELSPEPFEAFLTDRGLNEMSYSSGRKDTSEYAEDNTILSMIDPKLRSEMSRLLTSLGA
jgi:hypothetical protein